MQAVTVSNEASQAFRNHGWALIRRLFSDDEIARVSRWTDELVAMPEVPGRAMKYFEDSAKSPGQRMLSRIENFCPYHSDLNLLAHGPKLHGIVTELLGEDVVLFKDKINFKLPGADGFKAHQDVQAGWNAHASLHVTAMVSIDATSTANGCLEIARCEHRRELLGEMWRPLDPQALDYEPIETAPGDALFFDSFVPHRSQPNRTTRPRRVLYITYNRAREGDHRERYYAEKRANYPPDIERIPGRRYEYRV